MPFLKTVDCKLLTVHRKPKGFTLIELLIVITIIGILATFIVASFTSAQKKARDIRRKADLNAIGKAAELAHFDLGTSYPYCTDHTIWCLLTDSSKTTPDLVSSLYIKSIPQDPKSGSYFYWPQPNNCSNPINPPCTGYIIAVALENTNDKDTAGSLARCPNVSGAPPLTNFYVCSQ